MKQYYSIIELPVAITRLHWSSLKQTDLCQQFLDYRTLLVSFNFFGILLAFANNGMQWFENVHNFLNV